MNMGAVASTKNNRSAWLVLGIGALAFVTVAATDYLTGVAISFSVFYLVPVALAAWFGGRAMGVGVACLCGIAWITINGYLVSSSVESVVFWNAAVRFGFFLVVALLVSELKRALDGRSNLVLRDPRTGLLRPSAFFDDLRDRVVEAMVDGETSFTVAVIDLATVQPVPDPASRESGAALPAGVGTRAAERAFAQAAIEHCGNDALIARLSPREFAVLFGNIDEKEARERLAHLEATVDGDQIFGEGTEINSRVTTFMEPPLTVETMIRPKFSVRS